MSTLMNFFRSSHYPAVLLLSAGLTLAPAFGQKPSEPAAPAAQTEPAPESGQVVEDIVAQVNDGIITQSDYDRAEQTQEADDAQQGVPRLEADTRKKDLLRDLIDQQLLLSKGKELGITGDTELVKRLDDIRKQNHLNSMDDLEKAAQAQGVSFEDFKANILNGIITQKVVEQEVAQHLDIGQSDVRRYYDAHQSEFSHPESVTLDEILIGIPADATAEQLAAAQSKADSVETQLKAGANFADLAKANSTGPTAAEGGDLGEYTRGKLGKELEDAAFSLKAGQYTAPIRTKQGFLILRVDQHDAGGVTPFAQAQNDVEQALYVERMEPALRTYLTTLREGAAIFIKSGYVDSGASPNEIQITNSAYVPPGPKKKKAFKRTRFRGRTPKPKPQTASAANSAAGAGTPAAASKSKKKQQVASAQKPSKREKVRYGQAPRESLTSPSVDSSKEAADTGSQTASAATGDTSATAPASDTSSPIGGEAPESKAGKTRFSDLAKIRKPKQPKGTAAAADQPPRPSADQLATEKTQDTPLGLAGDDSTKAKKKKGKEAKTRYSDKKAPPKQEQQPYMGPSTPDQNQPSAPQPAAPAQQPAPAQSGSSQ
jgi:peptidyl-prolyl cis-trans isomerase SurA